MRRVIVMFVEAMLGCFLLVIGLTFLFRLSTNQDEQRSKINDCVSSKINVTENGSVYEPQFSDIHSMSSVLYEIKQTDLDISIYIIDQEVTREMRKTYRDINDSDAIRSMLNTNYNYSKESIVDTDGNVVKIVYRPSF